MHFIIVGSGRVGRLLTNALLQKNHTVSLISNDQYLLDLMPNHVGLTKYKGIAFDLDLLKKAGIDNAFGLASVTDDDNLNILTTRIAKTQFKVQKVVVRVYDQSKASVFQQLGIPTVSTIHWTVDNVLRELVPVGSDSLFVDSTGNISLSQVDYSNQWIGKTISNIEQITNTKVVYIERFGSAFCPQNNEKLQDDDKLHIAYQTKNKEEISNTFINNPEEGVKQSVKQNNSMAIKSEK